MLAEPSTHRTTDFSYRKCEYHELFHTNQIEKRVSQIAYEEKMEYIVIDTVYNHV